MQYTTATITLVLTFLLACTIQVQSQRTAIPIPHSWNPIVHISFPVNSTLLKSKIHSSFSLDETHGTAWLFVAASTTKFSIPGFPDTIVDEIQVFTTVSRTTTAANGARCTKRGFLILNYYWANEIIAATCDTITQSALYGCKHLPETTLTVNTTPSSVSFVARGVAQVNVSLSNAQLLQRPLLLQFNANVRQALQFPTESAAEVQAFEASGGCLPASCASHNNNGNSVTSLILDRYRATTFVQNGNIVSEVALQNITWTQVREVRLTSWQSNLFEQFPASSGLGSAPLFAGFDDIPAPQVQSYCERNRGRCFIGVKSANVVN